MTLPIRFGLPVLLIASLASAAAPECDRGCLRSLTDRYLDAMLAHNPSKAPFASKVRYTENTLEVQPGLGIWKTAAKLRPHRQYYQDPVSASALFRGVVEETGLDTASIVAIRLKTVGGKITEVEAVIARKGSHSTYTPDALRDVDPRLTSLVPASQRVSRDQLKAIAETYWDGIVAHDGSAVKAVKGCDRIENGLAMTNRTGPDAPPVLKADCGGSATLLTHIKRVQVRRYFILDEERGIAVGMFMLDVPGRGTPEASSAATAVNSVGNSNPARRMTIICELFKISGGQIQYIEATLTNVPYGSPSGWGN